MKHSKIYIISDAKGIGKTTTLQKWVAINNKISGFLTPVVNGKRMFYNIETKKLLPMETNKNGFEVGKYIFDKNSFEKVSKTIKQQWNNEVGKQIIIDEIGPLEIEKNLGFNELIVYLLNNLSVDKPDLILVVRENCLKSFLEKYKFKNVKSFTLNQFKNHFNIITNT